MKARMKLEASTVSLQCGDAGICLLPNGDIFINGRLAENDKEVVDEMRRMLRWFGLHEVHDS
jgi:hypothetical protein